MGLGSSHFTSASHIDPIPTSRELSASRMRSVWSLEGTLALAGARTQGSPRGVDTHHLTCLLSNLLLRFSGQQFSEEKLQAASKDETLWFKEDILDHWHQTTAHANESRVDPLLRRSHRDVSAKLTWLVVHKSVDRKNRQQLRPAAFLPFPGHRWLWTMLLNATPTSADINERSSHADIISMLLLDTTYETR